MNKFLTEAMGICFWINHDEEKCGCAGKAKRVNPINFFTWEGFGILWTWAQEQSWWSDLAKQLHLNDPYVGFPSLVQVINPEHFAVTIYDFLIAAQVR